MFPVCYTGPVYFCVLVAQLVDLQPCPTSGWNSRWFVFPFWKDPTNGAFGRFQAVSFSIGLPNRTKRWEEAFCFALSTSMDEVALSAAINACEKGWQWRCQREDVLFLSSEEHQSYSPLKKLKKAFKERYLKKLLPCTVIMSIHLYSSRVFFFLIFFLTDAFPSTIELSPGSRKLTESACPGGPSRDIEASLKTHTQRSAPKTPPNPSKWVVY